MLNQQTIEKLLALKLIGMAEAFKDQLMQPDIDRLSFEERFGLIVDRQWTWKEDRRMQRYLKAAKLKLDACVEDIDYKTPRGIDQSVMMRLISCDWIRHHQNIIITGPTGAGKSFLACALANKACREGYRTFSIRSLRLFYELAVSKGESSYGAIIDKLAKTQILALDDLGLAPMMDSERRDLLLEQGLDKQPPPQAADSGEPVYHYNIRGKDYYQHLSVGNALIEKEADHA
jgi:DNA replication protein DnaC